MLTNKEGVHTYVRMNVSQDKKIYKVIRSSSLLPLPPKPIPLHHSRQLKQAVTTPTHFPPKPYDLSSHFYTWYPVSVNLLCAFEMQIYTFGQPLPLPPLQFNRGESIKTHFSPRP